MHEADPPCLSKGESDEIVDDLSQSEQHEESILLPSVHTDNEDEFNSDDGSDLDIAVETDYAQGFSYDSAVDNCMLWMMEQPKETKKMIAVMMMDCFIHRFGLNNVPAAKEAGRLVGINEKSVRKWRKQFYSNSGEFNRDKRGGKRLPSVLDDEDVASKATQWIRTHAYVKGEPVMTSGKFCTWVNSDLFPTIQLPRGYPTSITDRTARKWLHKLGFSPTHYKKGVYVDGHERPDVIEYRKLYLKKLEILESTHLPPPLPSDGITAMSTGSHSASKKLVLIFHDESCFHSHEAQDWQWAEEGRLVIRPKGKGRGLMVSDFIDEYDGFLKHDHTEARVILKYGGDNEGYWNSDLFMKQVAKAVDIAELKYPRATHNLVWLFDQSSGHTAYDDDALNVQRMNVKPGGRQPVMRDTTWNGNVQRLVDDKGVPKGMKAILEERGVDTSKMKAPDMRLVLGGMHDFKYERTKLEKYLKERDHRVIFIPKFHCELNPIERVWGEAKRYTRSHCDYTFATLDKTVGPALDSVGIGKIQKYFRKVREYMQAYRDGHSAGPALESAVKSYKSHRRVPESEL